MFIFIPSLIENQLKMNPILRNVLAFIAAWIVGSIINFGLISLGPSIIPLPEGADMENLKESMLLFKPQHFIFPFLGHALGTLVGGFTVAKLAVTHRMKLAIGIGVFFLLGGIYMVVLAGGPLWFILLDLIVAYIPMGWLGGKLATRNLTS